MRHPEFTGSIHTQIADAVVRRLEGDVPLAGYLRQIEPIESERVRYTNDIVTPAVWVEISASSELPGAGIDTVETEITIYLVTRVEDYLRGRDHLRTRVVEHITRLLRPALEHEGVALVEGPSKVERLSTLQLRQADQIAITPIPVVYQSAVDSLTRELIYA